MATKQRRDALATGRERDERPARAGLGLQDGAHERVAGKRRAARLFHFTWIGLGRLNEITQRLEGRIRPHRDQRWLQQHEADRRQFPNGNVGFLLDQRVRDPDARENADDMRVAFFVGEIGGR